MIVAAFKIITDKPAFEKHEILEKLWKTIFQEDYIWHFFLDPEGITLRCLPQNANKVMAFFKREKIKCKRAGYFNPKFHEYRDVRVVGDVLQTQFHVTSMAVLTMPRVLFLNQYFERTCHIIVNQAGVHNFEWEANRYLDLAFQRADLQKKSLPLPKWVYKLYVKVYKLILK